MIEKRYRNNLNDKIAALRDAVPSLRAIMRHNGHENGEWNTDDIDGTGTDTAPGYGGLTPAHKLNKATVLSKAAEYIEQLEQNNAALAKDNYILRTRIAGLEMMMLNGQPLH
jgi:hypothetical protein